jgi:hypothetical protein
MTAMIRIPTRYFFIEILSLKLSKVIIDSISPTVKIFWPARAPQAPSFRTESLPAGPGPDRGRGRQEGAPYKKELPFREALRHAQGRERCRTALPFRAGSFKPFGSFRQGSPWVTAKAIGAGSDWVIHDNTLEFSNSYE